MKKKKLYKHNLPQEFSITVIAFFVAAKHHKGPIFLKPTFVSLQTEKGSGRLYIYIHNLSLCNCYVAA